MTSSSSSSSNQSGTPLVVDMASITVRASNDLVLGRVSGEGQAEFAASIDGELFARYVGDGLIVSTGIHVGSPTAARPLVKRGA